MSKNFKNDFSKQQVGITLIALSIANNWKSGNAGNGTVAFQSGLITGAQWDAVCKFIGW